MEGAATTEEDGIPAGGVLFETTLNCRALGNAVRTVHAVPSSKHLRVVACPRGIKLSRPTAGDAFMCEVEIWGTHHQSPASATVKLDQGLLLSLLKVLPRDDDVNVRACEGRLVCSTQPAGSPGAQVSMPYRPSHPRCVSRSRLHPRYTAHAVFPVREVAELARLADALNASAAAGILRTADVMRMCVRTDGSIACKLDVIAEVRGDPSERPPMVGFECAALRGYLRRIPSREVQVSVGPIDGDGDALPVRLRTTEAKTPACPRFSLYVSTTTIH